MGVELVACPREGEQIRRGEERGDVSKRLGWDDEQSVGWPACSVRMVRVSMLAGFGRARASRSVSILFSVMSFEGPTGHKTEWGGKVVRWRRRCLR